METHRALALAHQHRIRIEQHIAGAVQMLGEDPAAIRGPLARARWGLVQLLREYHLFKSVEMFDPAIRSGSPMQALTAARLQNACAAGWRGYCDYTLAWSARDIAGRWDDYRPAMLEMASAVRTHVIREASDLTALLGSARRTRRLAE